jgi:uncharacterized protein YjdB
MGAIWLILFCFAQIKLSGQTYGNVALGGGGYVTGIISHKTSGDIYCRTDVGGAYRWDSVNSKWIPLLDWCSQDQVTYQGVEAIALDPQNENNLYILAGTSYFNGGKTAILKSADKGNSFTEVVVTSKFTAHGNGMGRSNGERLAVDPNNSNILFCGSRANGLWKSTNGGSSWTLAWNGVTSTSNGNGICFVVFDPSSVSGGVTQTIYIGVSRTGADNIYKSTDGGSTFSAIQPDKSFMPHRAVLSSDNSTLYVVMADKEGPWNPGSGRVYKLATATGTWTNITPNGNNYPYGGISVDPTNANRIVVSTINVWSNNQFGNTWADFVFLSTNGGSTWTSKLSSTSTLNNNGIGWISGRGIHWSGCVDFDPLNTARVRIISGNGVFTCDNINASATSWKFDVKGMEETVVLDAISIPGGNFVTAVGDQFGAAYSDIYAYPTRVHTPTAGTNNGIAYAANNINKVVRVTDKIYYSSDQGATWPKSASINGSYGKVALSADGTTTLHCPDSQSTTYYSTNDGATWTSTGVTNVQNAHPIADYVNTDKFYIYSPASGQLLVSTNKGVSFTASSSNPGAGGSGRARAVPGNEGHVWVALANGLKYTTNNGTSWTKISNVTYCGAVGFGKAATGATYPAVYIWGTVGGVKGIYRSTDQGASWTRINDDAHEWGGPGNGNFVMGDMNVFGRAYMATVGRGLVCIESDSTVVAVTGVTLNPATASVNVNGTTQLTATALPSNATDKSVSWASGDTSVATVSPYGLVTGVAAGTATITVTTQDGGKTATCIVTVSGDCTPTPITPYIQVNGGAWQQTSSVTVTSGSTVILGPQPVTDGSWSWTGRGTSGTSREQTFTATSTCTAIATYTNISGCNSTQAFNITVTPALVAVTGVALSPTTASILIGGTSQLTATVAPSDASNKTVSWTSDNTSIATVDSYGLVTGVAAGSATITVTTQDGGITATCTVTVGTTNISVVKPQEKIQIFPNPSDGNFKIAGAKNARLQIYNMNGELVYFQILDDEIAAIWSNLQSGVYILKIEENGKVTSSKLFIK